MTTKARFEERRLEVLRGEGVQGRSVWLKDGEGREIYAVESGEGEPVLLVHGGLSQCAEWAPLAKRLAKSRRVILVDRPGCGLTWGLDYRGVDYRSHAAEFMESVLDALEVASIDIVANSMGGFFALAFALRHPSRIDSLTLIGAPAGICRYIPFPLRLMGNPIIGKLMSGEMDTATVRKRIYAPLLVKDADKVSEGLLELGALNNALPGVPDAARTMLQNGVGLRGWRKVIREEVAALDVPTLFVWGSDDAFESAGSGRELADRMSNAEFVEVADAGHIPWHDQPDACSAAILRYWSALRNSAAA